MSSSGADSYDLDTDANGTHIQLTTGTPANPAPIFTAQPYSIIFNGVTPQTSVLTVDLIEQDPVRVEVPVTFDISG